MKIAAVFIMALMAGAAAHGQAVQKGRVTVCMEGAATPDVARMAQMVATQIYRGIGVTVEWKNRLRGCPPDAIQVSASLDTPASLKPGALAYALPYEGTHIRVFYDRIVRQHSGAMAPFVLGHVLAHEIGHILQGTAQHSDSGVMKARWTEEDVRSMRFQPLSFEAGDVTMIDEGLAQRARRQAVAIAVFAR